MSKTEPAVSPQSESHQPGAAPGASRTSRGEQAPAQSAPMQAGPQMLLDDDQLSTFYANFCRVTGTPEELLIDCGLNAQPLAGEAERVVLNQRIVMNFFTAKRLLSALHMAVQRHESIFGNLETSIQKRVIRERPSK